MNDTTRIPIDDFDDFATCRVSGTSAGIRYQAAMEAIAQFDKTPPAPRHDTIALRGREPSPYSRIHLHHVAANEPTPGAIGESELPWRYMA